MRLKRFKKRKDLKKWWPRAESNCRHIDFQSTALPTELQGQNEARIIQAKA